MRKTSASDEDNISSGPQPLFNLPVLCWGKYTMISDLHLGLEAQLEDGGIYGTDASLKVIMRLKEMMAVRDVDELVLLGDVKNGVPIYSDMERRWTRKALREMIDHGIEIHIVKGNHDGSIENIVPEEVTIHPASGVVFDGVGCFHGHAIPSEEVQEARHLVMGHIHPAVCLDRKKSPCWLHGSTDDGRSVTVMPAFNPLMGGRCVNRPVGRYMAPYLRHNSGLMDSMSIISLDGINLGTVSDLSVI